MPSIKPNENKEDWIKRCVPVVMKEGKTQKQALGQCYGMWRENGKVGVRGGDREGDHQRRLIEKLEQ
jgi:GMP synthase-like glutamine amidotransferase